MNRPRHFIIVGTTNTHKFLKDQTGNRRYWPVKVKHFDVEALLADRDQLWAEAAHREAQGESIVLPESLWPDAAALQELFFTDDPWTPIIREYLGFDVPEGAEGRPEFVPTAPRDRVRVTAMWKLVGFEDVKSVTPAHQDRMNAIMQALGYENKTSRGCYPDDMGNAKRWCLVESDEPGAS